MSVAIKMNWRLQSSILAARYRACLLGDGKTLLLLLIQAPAIGFVCAMVWGSIERDTPSLYFVMVLACLWFGCINACREIVKERQILERERLFGLSMLAYVWSKFRILAALGLIQALILQMTIEWQLALKGNFIFQTIIMWGASLAGVGLGLIVSAIAQRQDRAVAVIPLLLIPQIILSEFVIPRDYFNDFTQIGEKLMPVYWSFESFKQTAATGPDWWWLLFSVFILYCMSLSFLILCVGIMQKSREI